MHSIGSVHLSTVQTLQCSVVQVYPEQHNYFVPNGIQQCTYTRSMQQFKTRYIHTLHCQGRGRGCRLVQSWFHRCRGNLQFIRIMLNVSGFPQIFMNHCKQEAEGGGTVLSILLLMNLECKINIH